MKQTLFSRILSLMLVMVLIFSMVPASVFATEAENDVDSSQSSGIDPPETVPAVTGEATESFRTALLLYKVSSITYNQGDFSLWR